MKRILSIAALLMCLTLSAYSQEFRVTYNENTEQEYFMDFQILEDAPETVEIIKIGNYPYETLEFPTVVNHEGKEYTLTSINLWSISSLIKKMIIPSTIRWIKSDIHSDILEEVVIDDAPIESFYGFYFEGGDIYNNNHSQFSNCTNLKSFSFGNACKITVMGWSFFEGCTSLSDVQLPETLTHIGPNAFGGCTSLKSIVIPQNVEGIMRSFKDCTSLETVQFAGEAVENINGAFSNCESLKNFSIHTTKDLYIGMETLSNCRQLTSADIQSNSLTISDNAFENCVGLSEFTYNPAVLNAVGQNAFLNCSSLTEFTIGPNTTIGGSAFAGCTSLREFKMTGEGWHYVDNGVLFNNNQQLVAYPPGKQDTQYSLPAGITAIAHGAFSGAVNLEKVTLGENVTDLGVMAFRDCPKLKEVELPASINHIPSGTFMGCEALEKVNLPRNYSYIGTGAFQDCRTLEEIELPENVQVIGESAFTNTGLKKVSVPEKVAEIRDNTFRGCTALASVSLPAGVTKIGLAALQDCSSLESINIPENLDTIAERTFKGCASLTEVVIPDAVKSVGMSAFEKCSSLKTVTTGNGVEKLGGWSFYECTELTKVVFGESLDSIGAQAFDGDLKIEEIICLSPEAPDFPTGFPEEVMDNAYVTVPEGCHESYYSNSSWAQMVEGWTPVLVETITIEGLPECTLEKGMKFTLNAVVTPDNASDASVTWSSDNPEVATVNYEGYVKILEAGSTVIRAIANDNSGCSASCVINATAGVEGIIDDSRPFKVYDMRGVLLIEDADKTRLRDLPAGIYILVQGNARSKFSNL